MKLSVDFIAQRGRNHRRDNPQISQITQIYGLGAGAWIFKSSSPSRNYQLSKMNGVRICVRNLRNL